MGQNYLASLSHFIPELLACLTMFGLILIEATYKEEQKGRGFLFLAAGLGLASVTVFSFFALGKEPVAIFTNSLIIDSFSSSMKMIMVLGTLGAVYLTSQSSDIEGNLKPEFIIMATGVLVGGMLLSSANNMLVLFIGIETLSILSYVLASLKKGDERSSEAGLKYSLYGGISSGIMLFGMSHIYGVVGTINFTEIAIVLKSVDQTQIAILLPAFLFFFVGIGYKIACVPFHMWAPDVYEGSPLPVTTFFSIVPKVAGLAALIRVSQTFFATPGALNIGWVGVLSIVAALTMTVGNVSAIGQRSVKRMLAYSSISHAGMMLMGVLVISELGTRSVIFYSVAYLFMTLVAFYVVSFVSDKYGNDHFERFTGLVFRYPLMAIAMCIVMFSLAGIPPFSGFVAKFHIFTALLVKKYYVLAVIAGLNSVVSLYYYLKIVRLMMLKDAESTESISGFSIMNQSAVLALTIPVVILGIFWEKLIIMADGAKVFLQ
ncbi:MAG: NADH-quinone oxidoreductase subunit N [Bacteriovoracaceae bacterium]|nr:NADH-quinone oxidoreductase subunit N [Bacteriovoracaceae bacterium]